MIIIKILEDELFPYYQFETCDKDTVEAIRISVRTYNWLLRVHRDFERARKFLGNYRGVRNVDKEIDYIDNGR